MGYGYCYDHAPFFVYLIVTEAVALRNGGSFSLDEYFALRSRCYTLWSRCYALRNKCYALRNECLFSHRMNCFRLMVVVFSYCGVSIFISWCQHFHSWYQYFYLLVVAMLSSRCINTFTHNGNVFISRNRHYCSARRTVLPAECLSGVFYIFSPFIYIFSPFISVCTIRSAVRPSQRSGRVVCFHSPCSSLSRAAERAKEFSPTSSLVPVRHVSGCSA